MEKNLPSMPSSATSLIAALVIPCFNEELALPLSSKRLIDTLGQLVMHHQCSERSFILFIDDGSTDKTWHIIQGLIKNQPNGMMGIRLAANVGHQAALLCGLNFAKDRCDFAISIDADLQDDLGVIPEMIAKHREGADLVLGVRQSRGNDSWFKKTSAMAYYKLAKRLGVNLVEDHADFRLISRQSLEHLNSFSEVNIFLRGLVTLLSSSTAIVKYHRQDRIAGESKYPFIKMLALSWNGITSFSTFPLRLISLLSLLVFICTLAMIIYAVVGFFQGAALPGWASTVIPLYFLGGVMLLSLSIIGEYISKIMVESKRRPRYLIKEVL